jgi:hypothetical protein
MSLVLVTHHKMLSLSPDKGKLLPAGGGGRQNTVYAV